MSMSLSRTTTVGGFELLVHTLLLPVAVRASRQLAFVVGQDMLS